MDDQPDLTDVFHYDEERDLLTVSFADLDEYDTGVRLYAGGVFAHQEDAYTEGDEYNIVQLEIQHASEKLPDEFIQQFLDEEER